MMTEYWGRGWKISTQYELCDTRESFEKKLSKLSFYSYLTLEKPVIMLQSVIVDSFVNLIFLFFLIYLLTLSPWVEIEHFLFFSSFWYMED